MIPNDQIGSALQNLGLDLSKDAEECHSPIIIWACPLFLLFYFYFFNGITIPIWQSKGTNLALHTILKRCVNHTTPNLSRALWPNLNHLNAQNIWPQVWWCNRKIDHWPLATLCSNKVLAIDNPWLAQTLDKISSLRFRSRRLFL